MLQPNFNLFFYGKYVLLAGLESYESNSDSGSGTVAVDGVGIEVKVGNESLDAKKRTAVDFLNSRNQVVQDKVKGLEDSLNFKNSAILKRLNKLKSNSRLMIAFARRKINIALNEKAIKSLKSTYALRLRNIMEQVHQIEIADGNRGKLIDALHKNVSSVRKEYLTAYQQGYIRHDNVERGHLEALLDAYLLRVLYRNLAVMKKMSSGRVNALITTVKEGRFIEGPIVDDINAVQKKINLAIKRWEDNEPRTVYQDSDWDFGHVNPLFGDERLSIGDVLWKNWRKLGRKNLDFIDSIQLSGLKAVLTNVDEFLPPLPDWGRGKDKADKYKTPTLDARKGKEYLAKLEKRMKFLVVANSLSIKLRAKGIGVSRINLLPSGNAARIMLKSNNTNIGYITVNQKGEITYTDPSGKNPIDIKGQLKDIPKLIKTIKDKMSGTEEANNKPVIRAIRIDGNGITVVGENLPKQAKLIKIDPSKAWVDISKGIKAGVQSVSIEKKFTKVDSLLRILLRKAIGRTVGKIPGIVNEEMIMSRIEDEGIDTLKKEILDKHKPKVVVWGIASREGGFNLNKKIALARALSAKRRLEKGNHGVQVITRWAIQGFGSNGEGEMIDSLDKYKSDEANMIKDWNKRFPSNKVEKASEIYARLSKPNTWKGQEVNFFNENFINARRVSMAIEYPKGARNTQIAMKFKKSPEIQPV